MNATITWKGKVQFSAIADSGHEIAIDGPPDLGGEEAGVRSMELMLLGLGGCSSFDVVNILTKGREHITDCVTQITATRCSTKHSSMIVAVKPQQHAAQKYTPNIVLNQWGSSAITQSMIAKDWVNAYRIIPTVAVFCIRSVICGSPLVSWAMEFRRK